MKAGTIQDLRKLLIHYFRTKRWSLTGGNHYGHEEIVDCIPKQKKKTLQLTYSSVLKKFTLHENMHWIFLIHGIPGEFPFFFLEWTCKLTRC